MGAVTMVQSPNTQDGVSGNLRVAFRDVTLSATYATNGETGLTPASVGMNTFSEVELQGCATNNFLRYIYATNLVQAFVSSTGAEVGNGVSLAGVTVRATCRGK